MRNKLFDWVTALITSAPLLAIIGLLIYFLKEPDKVEKWGAIIARGFSFVGLRWEKAGLAKDIQADINSFARKINIRSSKSLPYGAKIDWVSETTREGFIKDGNVVIKMKPYENQARNFLYATLEWVNLGLIPESRHLIDSKVLRALDLTMVNKVLSETKRHDSRQLFINEILAAEATQGSLLAQYCTAFNKLDEHGNFVGIVLPEYASLGEKVGNSMPNDKIAAESISFAVVLMKLANKKHGEDVNPSYSGQYINCSIVLVAKADTYFMYGLQPYLTYINKCAARRVKSIYVCGHGDQNISIVKRIKNAYENNKEIVLDWEKTFEGKKSSLFLHFSTHIE